MPLDSSPATAAPFLSAGGATRLLAALNLHGLDHLDPVILAALSDARPMLLIGPHGTAKSELLNRLAASLALSHRHYNASLISFDDLLGYPVPNGARDGIRWLRTQGDLWDAESVFLDEISRCRPETQNKLFSIIHEKRIQGLPLEHLRYRWAAMNPPVTAATEDTDDLYEGSSPLDVALADRFPWVIPIPSLSDFSPEARRALIAARGHDPGPLDELATQILEVRACRDASGQSLADWVTRHVDALVDALRDASLAISARRAVMIAESIHGLDAALQVLGLDGGTSHAAYLALKYGLPHRAQGRTIDEPRLLAIHRAALADAGDAPDSPWRRLRAIADPIERVAAALACFPESLDRSEVSRLVSDVYAGLSVPRRYLLSRHLLPIVTRQGCLDVPAFELISKPARKVRKLVEGGERSVMMERSKVASWDRMIAAISAARRTGGRDVDELGNYLLTLSVVEKESFDPAQLIEVDRAWDALFGTVPGNGTATSP